jgi:hypothetical protein
LKFKPKTFIIIKNNQGSVSLLGATLTSLLSLYLLFFALKMQVEYREAQYRKESYLCFKFLNTTTVDYITQITKLNWALRTAYAAQFSVIATNESIVIFKNLVLYRNAFHVSYMKNLFLNSYCSLPITTDYVKNLPYQTKNIFLLDTLVDETTKIRAKKWKNIISVIPKKIRSSHIFLISVEYSLDGPFLPNLLYTSKEIGKRELLSLNHFFGFQ